MNILFNRENEIRNIWWIAVFFIILSLLLFSLIMMANSFAFDITMLHQAIIISMASTIAQVLRRKPVSEITGSMNMVWLRHLVVGAGIGAVLMLLPVFVLTTLGYIQWEIHDFSFSTLRSGFSILLIAAVTEELLFRGFLFQRLIQAFGKWPAQLVIAGLFLLTHINNPGMTGITKTMASINIFIASIMFGIAYIQTASLAMPLGIHFMANFIQGPVLGFGVSGDKAPSLFQPTFDNAPTWLSGGSFGIEASILGLCFLIVITNGLYFRDSIKACVTSR